MPQKFYCSACGVELTHSRRAVPGKGHIFDLIDPHECEGYAIKTPEDGSGTVVQILDSLQKIEPITSISDGKNEEGRYTGPGDRRDDKSKITSTAPSNLLENIRGLSTSGGGDLEE